MKRIKFQRILLNWYSVALVFTSLIFIFWGSGILPINYSSVTLVVFGIILLLFELSKFFWYKNYSILGKNIILIRLNTLFPKIIKHKNVEEVYVNQKVMRITLKSNEALEFELTRIERNDIDDLADILVENSDAKYTNEVMHESFYKQDNP